MRIIVVLGALLLMERKLDKIYIGVLSGNHINRSYAHLSIGGIGMKTFNGGKRYHGSDKISGGKLKGATDSQDYFYFFCPKCPENRIMRLLEYGEHDRVSVNRYNDKCKSKAKYGFTVVFKLFCEECGFSDFVKISNTGWQGGKYSDALMK